MSISSELGVGTTVTMYVPRPVDEETGPLELLSPLQEIPKGLRVLLVEDAADVRATVSTLLQSLNCEVACAASGEQAMSMLGPGTLYDLLLTDIALGGGMRGTDLAAAVQQRLPRLGILLMSGFSAELLEADRQSPREWQLLQKPCSREDLARAIGHVLSARKT
jgi:CheY-like chemotaxis protein